MRLVKLPSVRARAGPLPLLLACMLALGASSAGAWQVSAQARAGVWTDNTSAGDRELAAPLSALLTVGGADAATGLRWRAEGWVGNAAYFADDRSALLREAYVEAPVAAATLRAGQLILPWGRADEINPTDSLVSRDWQLRTVTAAEQRIGNVGVEAVLPAGPLTVTAVWVPYLRSTRLPYINGLQNVDYATIDGRDSVGFRVDHTGGRADWGLSAYRGADLAPSLDASLTSILPRLEWRNYKILRLGADFAAATGASIVRGELAYTRTLDRIAPSATALPGQKTDYVKAVGGGEWELTADLSVNLQLVAQFLLGSAQAPPTPLRPLAPLILATQALVNQQPVPRLAGVAWRIEQRAADDALRVELAGLAYGSGQGSTVRLRLTHRFDDAFEVSAGANLYFGAGDGILGALKPNDTWFVQAQYTM